MQPAVDTVPLPPPQEYITAFNRQRFAQLAIGAPIAMCVGVTYSFGLISNFMKVNYNLTQGELTTISTVANLMGMFSLPGGMLFDYIGPQYALDAAVVLTTSGFVVLALVFSNVIAGSVALLAFANGLTWWGTGFMDVGSLMTNLFSFPLTQGEVVIVQKTFMGLGSTFLSLIFTAFFADGNHYVGYCTFVAIMVFAIVGLGASITRLSPYKRTTVIQKRYTKAEATIEAYCGNDAGHRRAGGSDDARSLATVHTTLSTSPHGIQQKTVEDSDRLSEQSRLVNIPIRPSEEEYQKAVDYKRERDELEAYSYFVAHTRAYIDRRRVNLSLLLLWCCLIFFAVISFANAYIEMSSDTHYALASVAALLMFSFGVLVVPMKLPAFFDFPCLPSLVPVAEEPIESDDDNDTPHVSIPRNGLRQSQRRASAGAVSAEGQLEPGVAVSDEVNYQVADDNTGPSDVVRRSMNASRNHGSRQPIDDSEPPAVTQLEELEKWLGIGPVYRGKIPSVTTPFLKTLVSVPIVWGFFFTSFAVWGAGGLIVSNSTQIYKSLNLGDFNSSTNSLYVAVMGIASALGRVITGYVQMKIKTSNSMLHREQRASINANWEKLVAMDLAEKRALSPEAVEWLQSFRPVHHGSFSSVTFLLPVPALFMVIGCACIIALPVGALVIGLFLASGAFGMSWAVTVLACKEIYEVDVAKLYNLNFIAAMLAAVFLNSLMFGNWYDEEANKQHALSNTTTIPTKDDDKNSCSGLSCIEGSMLVCLGLNAAAVLIMCGVVLWLRRLKRSEAPPSFITPPTTAAF